MNCSVSNFKIFMPQSFQGYSICKPMTQDMTFPFKGEIECAATGKGIAVL